jgi:type IV secretory pathway VirB2 component (pilin)
MTRRRHAALRWLRSTCQSVTVLTALVLFPALALAQRGSPFDTGFTNLQTLFTGTIAKVASLIAIVIGGYQFAHGEALACLFHILLLHKIGMPREVLTRLMTKSIIAERLIKPSLGEVGLEIASDKN